jgi:hypothetical protein
MREIRQGFTNFHDKKHQMDLWDKWENILKHQVHISCLLTYDLYSSIRNSFDGANPLFRSLKGLKIETFFGPKWHLLRSLPFKGHFLFYLSKHFHLGRNSTNFG